MGYSSGPVLGITVAGVVAGMAAQDTGAAVDTFAEAMATDAGVIAGATLAATQVVDVMAETPSTVEEDSIAESAVGSTAEACRTVEAVFTAAVVDAGNVPGIECTTASGTKLPAVFLCFRAVPASRILARMSGHKTAAVVK